MSHVPLNLPGQPPGDSSALGLAKAAFAFANGLRGLWEALDSALKSRRLDVMGTIDASDRHGVTALHLAANAGRVSTVRALIARGASLDPCTVAVEDGDDDEEEEEFAGDWQTHYGGWTPLLLACRGGHHECVSVLVAAGASVHASVDVSSSGDCVESTLTLSAETGSLRSLQMVLDAGASVHVPANSWSPLHAAIWGRGEARYECVAALLRAGADANALDHVGRSVLELAVQPRRAGTPRLISTLLRKGARPLAADSAVLSYYDIKVYNPQIITYFDAIRRAGGYARYEAMRRAPFVAALTRCGGFPIPDDMMSIVVAFWVRRALEY